MPPKRRTSRRSTEAAVPTSSAGKGKHISSESGGVDGTSEGDDVRDQDESEEYEVEEILEVRGTRKRKYLIKWIDYEEPTWEPAEFVRNCPDALRAFEEKSASTALTGRNASERDPVNSVRMPSSKRLKKHRHHTPSSDDSSGNNGEGPTIEDDQGERADGSSGDNQADTRVACDPEIDVDLTAPEDDRRSATSSVDYPYETGADAELEEVLERRDSTNGPEYFTRWSDGLQVWVRKDDLASPELVVAFDAARALTEAAEPTPPPPAAAKVTRTTNHPPRAKKPATAKEASPAANPRLNALERSYIGTMVAFSPQKDTWLNDKIYAVVGSAFITGRVSDCSFSKKKILYEVRWVDSVFQNRVEKIGVDIVRQGRYNHERLSMEPDAPRWTSLCRSEALAAFEIEDAEDLEEYDQYDAYEPPESTPVSLAEVEKIGSMRFEPNVRLQQPTTLYKHADGSTTTKLKPEYRHIFEHSASASFFAYLPISFWKQVLDQTNAEARERLPDVKVPFTLSELMKFLGMLWYMSTIKKGEMKNYWDNKVEDAMLGHKHKGLADVMSLRRFKMLRSAFCFRKGSDITPDDTARDAAVRIRSLLNMLKQTGGRYIDVGRDLAVDEASVAARSKFARHIIVYNPRKPTGKYHFKFYMVCCATSWIALNFRLHAESTLEDRLEGVHDEEETRAFGEEVSKSSKTRQVVLEITKPFFHTGRVVNCDNYYTSVQLLEALRIKGLHCRGTVKRLSKHFPRHVVLGDPGTADKNANKSKQKNKERSVDSSATAASAAEPAPPSLPSSSKVRGEVKRGDYLQAVSRDSRILAASWCDGNVVTIISNADSSALSSVTRLVRGMDVQVPAPTCIKEYNQYMQGVDRHDQLRARFSLADGHSFQKWYKKLGFAIIDMARVNAFQTRKLLDDGKDRDDHWEFVGALIDELVTGKWKNAPSGDVMLYDEDDHAPRSTVADASAATSSARSPNRGSPRVVYSSQGPTSECSGVESAQLFAASRRKRMCIVCRFEGRNDTLITEGCVQHKVSLCKRVHETTVPYGCQEPDWTCWEKYHLFYLAKETFMESGCVRRSSVMYKEKKSYEDLQKRTQDNGARVSSNVKRTLPFIECTSTPDFVAISPEISYV